MKVTHQEPINLSSSEFRPTAMRSWMHFRDNETVREHHERLNRTCFKCGKDDFESRELLDEHESSHFKKMNKA